MGADDLLTVLATYRDEKQTLAERNANRLFAQALYFVDRYANIREKVRAKHLFRQQLSLKSEESLSKINEIFFQQWFLFDYKTVQGETMFGLFLKQEAKRLTEPDMILGALFLTTYFEPFKIEKIDQKNGLLLISDVLENKIFTVSYPCNQELPENSYICLRRLPLISKDWAIGEFFIIKNLTSIIQLVDEYKNLKHIGSILTWRTFLKNRWHLLII